MNFITNEFEKYKNTENSVYSGLKIENWSQLLRDTFLATFGEEHGDGKSASSNKGGDIYERFIKNQPKKGDSVIAWRKLLLGITTIPKIIEFLLRLIYAGLDRTLVFFLQLLDSTTDDTVFYFRSFLAVCVWLPIRIILSFLSPINQTFRPFAQWLQHNLKEDTATVTGAVKSAVDAVTSRLSRKKDAESDKKSHFYYYANIARNFSFLGGILVVFSLLFLPIFFSTAASLPVILSWLNRVVLPSILALSLCLSFLSGSSDLTLPSVLSKAVATIVLYLAIAYFVPIAVSGLAVAIAYSGSQLTFLGSAAGLIVAKVMASFLALISSTALVHRFFATVINDKPAIDKDAGVTVSECLFNTPPNFKMDVPKDGLPMVSYAAYSLVGGYSLSPPSP